MLCTLLYAVEHTVEHTGQRRKHWLYPGSVPLASGLANSETSKPALKRPLAPVTTMAFTSSLTWASRSLAKSACSTAAHSHSFRGLPCLGRLLVAAARSQQEHCRGGVGMLWGTLSR